MNINSLETATHNTITLVKEVAHYIASEKQNVKWGDLQIKDTNSFVTYVDKQAEKKLIEGLKKIVPQASFITEEGMIDNEMSDLAWIVDPLDGTTNFLYGIPMYSISVALAINGECALGVVHAIPQDETFYAWNGSGAYLNDEKISINKHTTLRDALVGTGFSYDRKNRTGRPYQTIKTLIGKCRGMRRMGSAAMDLAFVACGRLDIYYESNLNAWDVAAGGKIVQEAGGIVTDFDLGKGWMSGETIIAGNHDIHRELHALISSV